MATWGEFAQAHPELAEFGASRLPGNVAYLATIRQDGSPRVHPVTPILGQGHLFLFMEPTSPKGQDLRRDGRYALHCAVSGSDGASGEFLVSGRAVFVEDPVLRALATQAASYTPKERYVLFELHLESALSTIYQAERPVRQRWKES